MSEGKFIPSWILFPRKNKRNNTKISAVGVEVEGGAHLCFTSASCYVAPYLGLQGMLLPSHKKFAWRFCCSLNMFLHSVPSSREQRWKSMLTLWPGFAKQYSIHPVPNAQYITRPFFYFIWESYLPTVQSLNWEQYQCAWSHLAFLAWKGSKIWTRACVCVCLCAKWSKHVVSKQRNLCCHHQFVWHGKKAAG